MQDILYNVYTCKKTIGKIMNLRLYIVQWTYTVVIRSNHIYEALVWKRVTDPKTNIAVLTHFLPAMRFRNTNFNKKYLKKYTHEL